MKRLPWWLLLLAACTPDDRVAEAPAEPVVVYAAFEDETEVAGTLDLFTQQTGVPVILRRGPADRIVTDLIESRVSPPADLLITRSVIDAWRAAEESALRPLFSEQVAASVPDWAVDPEKLWFALAVEHAVIAYAGEPPAVADVAELADEAFAGQLCLSSSSLPTNRAVIAMLIDQMGIRPAELTVRAWIGNLAEHPFPTATELAAAISAGNCRVGILPAGIARQAGLEIIEPATRYVDVQAVGVARHAHNPDGAVQLAEWLASRFSAAGNAGPGGKNVGVVAWRYEDAVKLAERARYY